MIAARVISTGIWTDMESPLEAAPWVLPVPDLCVM